VILLYIWLKNGDELTHFTVSNLITKYRWGLGRHGNTAPQLFGPITQMKSAPMVCFAYELQFGYRIQKGWSQRLKLTQ